MDSNLLCELCQKTKPKHNIHICESGHTICVNCNECLTSKNEYTDVPSDTKVHDVKKCTSRKHLAGGDSKQMNKRKVTTKKKTTTKQSKKHEIKKLQPDYPTTFPLNTTLIYKNPYFHENESNISNSDNKNDIDNIRKEKSTRPIICPVLHCQKTIVLETILKHFAFDHAKIPSLTIEMKKPLKILLNPCSLTTNSQCIAIIKATEIQFPMLLMAAKICNIIDKSDTDVKVSKNKSDFQINNQNKAKKINTSHYNNGLKYFSDYSVMAQSQMGKDIVIWICRLNTLKHVCGITVTRDNALSYSYVGGGLHVQNAQDPVSVYKSPESLTIRHNSIAKLQDDNANLHVYIYLLK